MLSPLLDPDLRVHAVPKPLKAQELIAELPVERFVGGILPRLPRVDQRRVNARVTEPVLSKNPIDAVRRADSTLDARRVATFVTAESLC